MKRTTEKTNSRSTNTKNKTENTQSSAKSKKGGCCGKAQKDAKDCS